MMYIVSVPFNKVQKGKFKGLVSRTVGIVEKSNYSYYEQVFNNLKAAEKDADRLDISVRKYATTEELQELRKEQKLIVGTIVQHKKNVRIMNDGDLNDYVGTTSLFIEKHLGSFTSENESNQTDKVAKLFMNMDNDEVLKAALSATWYDRSLNKLRPINERILASTKIRTSEKSGRMNYQESKEIMKALKDALLNLFRGIELAIYLNPTADFKDLIKELNNMLMEYRSPILANDTRNKNAALKDALKSAEAQVTETKTQPSETDIAAKKLSADDKNKAA